MTNHIITLPLLVNLFISIILMFYWRKVRLQKIVSVAGSIIGLAVAIYVFVHVYQNGTQTVASGSWFGTLRNCICRRYACRYFSSTHSY